MSSQSLFLLSSDSSISILKLWEKPEEFIIRSLNFSSSKVLTVRLRQVSDYLLNKNINNDKDETIKAPTIDALDKVRMRF